LIGRRWRCIGLAAVLACGESPDRATVGETGGGSVQPNDTLVLTSGGAEVWLTLARSARHADGSECVERGLEIRRRGTRTKVPLLYTGAPPVLLNDTTMRAVLWTHCQPGDPYLIDLRSGHPVRERRKGGA
jgi:hypothetical protein